MAGLIGRIWSTLIRILLLLFGLVMFFGVMFVAAVATVVFTAWALLRGRRPVPFDFGWKGPVDWRSGARRKGAGRPSTDDVVDIEAREIENGAPPPPEHRDQPPS